MKWLEAAVLAAIAGFLAFGGYRLGVMTKQAEWDTAVISKKEGEEAALQAAARAISKIEVKSEKHIQPLLTEVRTNTVYRSVDCQHSADSLRHLNSLITGDESGAGGLPEANPAH